MKVLIIGGGISDERDVALKSSASVHKAAQDAGYDCDLYDWDGEWNWLEDNLSKYDVVFPVLHGEGGEDGQIQKFLESKSIKYVGTKAEPSRVCFDKQKTLSILADQGVLVPRGELVDYESYIRSDIAMNPHVLKPVDGGSTIDSLINIKLGQTEESILLSLFEKHEKLLLEEFIEGYEFTVPILEGKDLPVISIIPPEGQSFDYENKYNGKTQEICPPKNIDETFQHQLKELGLKVHNALNCSHFSRVDIILSNNKPYVLEINTIPGMTEASLFPKAAQASGISMPALVDYLINLALAS